MKREKRWSGVLSAVLGVALFAGVAIWMLSGVRAASEASEQEGFRQAELSVRQAAVSIYALEGAYPESYEALRQRSGIAIDEEKYAVVYEIFASNIMPEITVVRRNP
ncbi:MAG: hypothetical protein IKS66_06535 [Oscillospiraceae bacterium]|nr:hypothetical protein [Oscillospiraceae bacterium]